MKSKLLTKVTLRVCNPPSPPSPDLRPADLAYVVHPPGVHRGPASGRLFFHIQTNSTLMQGHQRLHSVTFAWLVFSYNLGFDFNAMSSARPFLSVLPIPSFPQLSANMDLNTPVPSYLWFRFLSFQLPAVNHGWKI